MTAPERLDTLRHRLAAWTDRVPEDVARCMVEAHDELAAALARIAELEAERDALVNIVTATERVMHSERARATAAEERAKRMAEALTASADTKAAYMGEVECESAHPSHSVPWTSIKQIMRMIRTRAALAEGETP